jgi:hypothetical protein
MDHAWTMPSANLTLRSTIEKLDVGYDEQAKAAGEPASS